MISNISEITTQAVITYFLVFCRVGAIFMTMPGLGEAYVATRIRLIAAIIMSIIVAPVIGDVFSKASENVMVMTLNILNELIIGIALGFMVKILMSAISLCGHMISGQSGLSAAQMFDPNTESQGAVEGNFLSAIIVLMIFATNMHHTIIYGIVESYKVFGYLGKINFSNLIQDISVLMGQSFIIAFKMASPHIVIGIILMFSAGVLSRLMPNIQIFFLMMPIQILLSFMILTITVGSIIMWYFDILSNNLIKMFGL